MSGWRVLCSGVVCCSMTCTASAEILYTLVSPNEQTPGRFGQWVSDAGDVNNDGFDDVIVGAFLEYPGTSPEGAGRAYVFDGQTGSVLYTLQSPNEQSDGRFGGSVSGAGDVNNDGHDDVIVGASREEPGTSPTDAGRAYVFSGQTGLILYTLVSPNEETDGRFGGDVSCAGDVNGDGYDDVVVGAPWEDPAASPSHAGRAYVFSGQTGSVLYTLQSPNEETDGWFGEAVSDAGDVNNDGRGDVIIGAHNEDPGMSPTDAGRAYVFSGANGSLLYSLQSQNEQYEGWFGCSVSGAGDVDGNNFDDVIVGACREGLGTIPAEAGRAYVFGGLAGIHLYTLQSPNEEPEGWFGVRVSSAGDVNANGTDDVIVGANGEDPGSSPSDAGRAYVFSGKTGYLLQSLSSPNEETDGSFGWSASGAGDVNNDGRADVIVGADLESPGTSPPGAGRAYVIIPTPKIELSGELSGGTLQLAWTTWEGATSYWVYGADNLSDFVPGVGFPYPYRLAVVPAGTTNWSTGQGIGDPDHNWTYLVVAIHSFPEEELTRSNRYAEFDFAIDVP